MGRESEVGFFGQMLLPPQFKKPMQRTILGGQPLKMDVISGNEFVYEHRKA